MTSTRGANAVIRTDPPINASDFGVNSQYVEMAENYYRWRSSQERELLREAHIILNGLSDEICKISHHTKKDQHAMFDRCPIESRRDDLLSRISNFLK